MGNSVNYVQVVPESHFWTDLEQLLEFFKHQEMTQEYLLTGLENTKKNGYELQQLKNVTDGVTPYFLNITLMSYYVKKAYNQDNFTKMLMNTIKNGFELIENKKNNMKRTDIYKCLDTERDYQDLRWSPRREKNQTPDEQKPPSEWINYIEHHLNMAKIEIYHLNDENALAEIRKVAALAVRCLELHGCPERIIPEDLK